MIMKSKVKLIKNSINNGLNSSTIHALPNIIREKFLPIRIFWLICFLLSTAACFFLIVKTINDFLNHDVVSKIEVSYKSKLKFPIVSFCFLNPFPTESGQKFLKIYENKIDKLFQPNIFPLLNAKSSINRSEFGYQANEVIISCFFNYNPCDLDNDFVTYFDEKYGNCFSFNTGKNSKGETVKYKYTTEYDLAFSYYNGLEIVFFYKNSSHMNDIYGENGMIAFIDDDQADSTTKETISLSTGSSTKITMNKFIIRQVSKPYSDCTNNLTSFDSYHSECYKKTIKKSQKYHFKECNKLCVQKYFGKHCNCYIPNYEPYYSDLKSCLDANYTCMADVYNKVLSDQYNEYEKFKNECDCPRECENSEYSFAISSSDYPSRDLMRKILKSNDTILDKFPLGNLTDYQTFKQSLVKAKIYFSELKETIVNHEIKMQPVDVVSSVGGLLGLFLGMSFLSIVEVLEILIKSIWIIIFNNSITAHERSPNVK